MNDTLKIEGCQDKIKIKVGSVVEIKLEAIPGTGSQWLLKDSSQLLQLLDGDNLKFSTPDTKQPTPGQKGRQALHFKAIKKGEETIHLEYKRTWETEISDSCKIKIEVN
jgi:predicted secreted protein